VPPLTKCVQRILVRLAVTHHVAQPEKEGGSIEPGQNLDELARGRVGDVDVDERVGGPAGRGRRVAYVSGESPAVDLEQVAAVEHIEGLCFLMPM